MKSEKAKISLALKIFGIAIVMLTLLCASAYISSKGIKGAKDKMADLSDYLIPLTNIINNIEVNILEQELSFERVLTLYKIKPVNREALDIELQYLQERGKKADAELEKALALSRGAIKMFYREQSKKTVKQILPFLENIKREHNDFTAFIRKAMVITNVEKKEGFVENPNFLSREERFNREIENIREQIENHTGNTISTALEDESTLMMNIVLLTTMAFIMGILLAFLFTRGVTGPVRKLMDAMRRVKQGDLNVDVKIKTGDEIFLLSVYFRKMVKELLFKESIMKTFGKYVDPRVVKSLVNDSEEIETEGQKQIMTVMFTDIEEGYKIAENFSSSELVHVMNRYLSFLSDPVSRHRGVIDKFIDTTLMSFWGPPFIKESNHSMAACSAALEQLGTMNDIRDLIAVNHLDFRIGIATGALIVGNMGSDQAKSYTVLGDTVNIASRLKGACKQYGARIMMTEETISMLTEEMFFREIDLIRVVGKEEPVRVFELLGHKDSLSNDIVELKDIFENKALRAYREMAWDMALKYFKACLNINPNDTPSTVFIERIDRIKTMNIKNDWDGVWKLEIK